MAGQHVSHVSHVGAAARGFGHLVLTGLGTLGLSDLSGA